jgi:hypothetical protein
MSPRRMRQRLDALDVRDGAELRAILDTIDSSELSAVLARWLDELAPSELLSPAVALLVADQRRKRRLARSHLRANTKSGCLGVTRGSREEDFHRRTDRPGARRQTR